MPYMPVGTSGGYGQPVAQFNMMQQPYGGFDNFFDLLGNQQNNATQMYLGNLGANTSLLQALGGWQNNLAMGDLGQRTQFGLSDRETDRARIADQMQRYLGDLGLQGQRYTADQQLAGIESQTGAQRYLGELGLQGTRLQSENQLAGVRDTNRSNLEATLGSANLANVPSFLQQERFGQILPLFAGVLGQPTPPGGGGYGGYGGYGGDGASMAGGVDPRYLGPPGTPGGGTPGGGVNPPGIGPPGPGHGPPGGVDPRYLGPPGTPGGAGGQAGGPPQIGGGTVTDSRGYRTPVGPGVGAPPPMMGPPRGNSGGGGFPSQTNYGGGSPPAPPTMPPAPAAGGAGGGGGAAGIGGGINSFPQVAQSLPMNPTISPQQQRQLVNQAVGQNEADYGRAVLDAREGMGNRGWSPNSPAISDFIQRADLNRAMANTQARTQVPLNVAQMNQQGLVDLLRANTGAAGVNVSAYGAREGARSNYLNALARLMG